MTTRQNGTALAREASEAVDTNRRAGKDRRAGAAREKQQIDILETQVAEARENTAAIVQIVTAVSRAKSTKESVQAALDAVRSAFKWAYGSYWTVSAEARALVFSMESGSTNEEFRRVTLQASFAEGVGLAGRAWRQRDVHFVDDLANVSDCPRATVAKRAGVTSGVCMPIICHGNVIGTMDFFTAERVSLSPERIDVLRKISELVSASLERVDAEEQQRESGRDTEAVSGLLRANVGRTSVDGIAKASLDLVRSSFGWGYAAYWVLDEAAQVMRFSVDSGDTTDEFRRSSRDAVFREGDGLCGRAWRQRDVTHVADLSELTSCPRADAARRAGVKTGLAMPIMVNGRVVGAVDFTATEALRLSEHRLEALRDIMRMMNGAAEQVHVANEFERDVKAVVSVLSSSATELEASAKGMAASVDETRSRSQAVAAASEQATRNVQTVASSAEELTASIREIAGRVQDASNVAQHAVRQAASAGDTMRKLGASSHEIGQVVKVITSIAQQTNLLALNATIEAARAGEAGKGFAVVANEVKELARQTARATEEIETKIGSVQSDADSAVRVIQEISDVIGKVNEISGTIAAAVEEQNAATGEISRNVTEAAHGTADVSVNIVGVTQVAEESGRTAIGVMHAAGQLSTESERLASAVDLMLSKLRARKMRVGRWVRMRVCAPARQPRR